MVEPDAAGPDTGQLHATRIHRHVPEKRAADLFRSAARAANDHALWIDRILRQPQLSPNLRQACLNTKTCISTLIGALTTEADRLDPRRPTP